MVGIIIGEVFNDLIVAVIVARPLGCPELDPGFLMMDVGDLTPTDGASYQPGDLVCSTLTLPAGMVRGMDLKPRCMLILKPWLDGTFWRIAGIVPDRDLPPDVSHARLMVEVVTMAQLEQQVGTPVISSLYDPLSNQGDN